MSQLNKPGIGFFIKWKCKCVGGKAESQKQKTDHLLSPVKLFYLEQYNTYDWVYGMYRQPHYPPVLFPSKFLKYLKSLDPQKILFNIS